jgi:fructokinase
MFLVCGDSLFDFFLDAEDGPGAATFAARVGGSPLNVALGLSRLDCASGLLTGLSDDMLGKRIARVLDDEGVSTAYAVRTSRPTTISLVGLDAHGVPEYQFYGNGAADIGVALGDLPAIGADVVGLHFGSYSIAVAPVGDAFAALARREAERFISLDPNIRPTIEPDMAVWRSRIDALLPAVDLVKISAEDLELLHPGRSAADFASDMLGRGVKLVVVTDGGATAGGWTASGLHATATPPRVDVIDTVGAGDTFQAALIAQLCAHPDGPKAALAALDATVLHATLDYAARAAAITCSRRGADLPRAAELV